MSSRLAPALTLWWGWRGGRAVDQAGYVTVQVLGRGRIREHRLVMEQIVGRRLEPCETVHHRNGDKADNRPENLDLLSLEVHSALRLRLTHCPSCDYDLNAHAARQSTRAEQ